MSSLIDRMWEFPLEEPSLGSSGQLSSWVSGIATALQTAVGSVALVRNVLDDVPLSAGDVLHVTDPAGRGATVIVAVERLPQGAPSETYALVEVDALSARSRGSVDVPIVVSVDAGYVFWSEGSQQASVCEYSRGDEHLISAITQIVTRGVAVPTRRGWRRTTITIPPYGG